MLEFSEDDYETQEQFEERTQMKQKLEPYRQKYATEMTFDEFLDWAVGHIVFGIGHGDSLRTNVHMILNQAIQNEVFGTKKKMPVEPTK